MNNWKEYFLETTIDLGYSYFIGEQVKNFKVKQKQITANITSNENYHAIIDLVDHFYLEKMVCSCPCLSNDHCPHLVAVLFEYNKYLQKKDANNSAYLVSYAEDSQIRPFLKMILKENDHLAKRFQQYIYSDASFDINKYQAYYEKQSASSLKKEPADKKRGLKKKKQILSVKQMEYLNYSKQKIQHTIQENWHSPTIRTQYVNYLLKNRIYKEAEKVLQESLLLDRQSPDLVQLHRYSLKKLYYKLGKKEAYINQVFKLLIENDALDMNLVHQLKKTCSKDEWISLRNRLFQELHNHQDIGLLYSQEKCYNLLLNRVLETSGIKEANRYFNILKKQTPEALLQKYEYELRKIAHTMTTRNHYHKLVRYIEEMATLPNSMISVQLLIKELKEKYPRKKAMIQELKLLEKKM